MMDDKGMATAELLFVTLIALFVAGAMLGLVSNELNQNQVGNLGESRITGESVAEALNTVFINGNGYSVTIHLDSDPSLDALIFSSGNASSLTIINSGKNVTIPIVPKQFAANYTLNSGKSYQIRNANGTLVITEIVG